MQQSMGSVALSEIDRKIIANADCLWSQRVVNHAKRILEDCRTPEAIEAFFKECEKNLKDPDRYCRIAYNTEVHKFGGDEFGYVWFFMISETLKATMKVAVSLDALAGTIIIGNMEIASKKEEAKLEKHLNSIKTQNTDKESKKSESEVGNG